MEFLRPLELKNLSLKNRVLRAPFQTSDCGEGGTVPESKADFYAALARNQIGLIVTGQMAVLPSGIVGDYQDMMFYARHVEEQKKIPLAVHREGGKIVAQVNYAGAKASRLTTRGLAPLAPAAFTFGAEQVPSREATGEEVHAVADAFALAVARTKAAGYDGAVIHAAHSYFISEFLNPYYNHRTDEFGGSRENRFRLLGEVLEKAREAAGADYPILVKMECNAAQNDEAWAKDVAYFANQSAERGAVAVEFSGCDYIPLGFQKKRLFYLERIAALKKEISVPVSLEGGVRTLAEMERVMDAGIDLVGIGRPLLCEPDLIPRLLGGQAEAACTNCTQCFAQFRKDGRYCVQHVLKS